MVFGSLFVSTFIGFLAVVILICNNNFSPQPLRLAPPPELKGALAPKFVKNGVKIAEGIVTGPESIVVDKDGTLYTCLADGRCVKIVSGKVVKIVRLTSYSDCDGTGNKFAYCGRPLGLRRRNKHEFFVADAIFGIYLINFENEISQVVFSAKNYVGGVQQKFPDDLDIIDNDTIVYSDASTHYGINAFMLSFLENGKDGRIIQLKLSTGKAKVIAEGFSFPNGVQVHPDKQSIVISESVTANIHRYYFAGPKKGRREIFIENLPGFPDNIRVSANKKSFYVALFSVRLSNQLLFFDVLGPHTWVKKVVGVLMTLLSENLMNRLCDIISDTYGIIVELDLDGKLINSYHDSTGTLIHSLSEVVDDGGKYLYLGSFINKFIGRITKH